MTVDFERMRIGKDIERKRLANLPIGEKLDMLDKLRDRTLEIRAARKAATKQLGQVSQRAEESNEL